MMMGKLLRVWVRRMVLHALSRGRLERSDWAVILTSAC